MLNCGWPAANEVPMKALVLFGLPALAGCQNPKLSSNLNFGPDGVSVNPTLSESVGDATVTVEN